MKKLVIYSTPMCASCQRLKQYLYSNGYKYSHKDLMMDEEAGDYLESLGIRSSPVLQVDDRFYVGAQLAAENLTLILGEQGNRNDTTKQ